MEKFYWAPTREDRVGVSMGIFKEDGVSRGEVEQIVDTFPGQSIDFFGALRARVYDDKVRDFVKNIGMEHIGARLINSKDGKVGLLTSSCNLTFSPPNNFAHNLSMSRLLAVCFCAELCSRPKSLRTTQNYMRLYARILAVSSFCTACLSCVYMYCMILHDHVVKFQVLVLLKTLTCVVLHRLSSRSPI